MPNVSRIERLSGLLHSEAAFQLEQAAALHRLPIAIAGIPLVLETSDKYLANFWSSYFADYRIASATPETPRFRAEPWREDVWEDADPEFNFAAGPGSSAVFQRDFCARPTGLNAFAWMAPEQEDATHNALRWFLAPLLLRHDALLMHAAGAIRDERGFLFFGVSGAGKSTTAGWIQATDPSALVVGDDSAIVRIEGGQAYLHSAPLGCGYSREAPPAARAKLAGCFHLVQSSEDRLVPLSPARATALLLSSAMFTESDWALRTALAERFVRLAPGVQDLHLQNSPKFWERIMNPC